MAQQGQGQAQAAQGAGQQQPQVQAQQQQVQAQPVPPIPITAVDVDAFTVKLLSGVVKLREDNYATWKREVEDIVRDAGFYPLIERNALAAEAKADQRCRLMIRKTLEERFIDLTEESKTTHMLWERLKSLQGQQARASRGDILHSMHQLKLDDPSKMLDHLGRLRALRSRYRDAGGSLDDEVYTGIIYTSLPDSMKQVAAAARRAGQANLQAIEDELLYEARVLSMTKNELKDEALFAGGVPGRNNGSQVQVRGPNSGVQGRGPQCWLCHNFGHVKRNCPTRPRGAAQPGQAQQQQQANLAEVILQVAEMLKQKPFVVDSGATAHVVNKPPTQPYCSTHIQMVDAQGNNMGVKGATNHWCDERGCQGAGEWRALRADCKSQSAVSTTAHEGARHDTCLQQAGLHYHECGW